MKLKIVDLSEKQLKDYLVASSRIKELPEDKLGLVLSKYAMTTGEDRQEIEKILIEAHLKTSICIANRYRGAGISFAGLIRAGNAGLISAVKKWEGGSAEEFVHSVTWSIEGAIIDALIKVKKEAREL